MGASGRAFQAILSARNYITALILRAPFGAQREHDVEALKIRISMIDPITLAFRRS